MNATIEYRAQDPSDYAWSISVAGDASGPLLTSQRCSWHVTNFMKNPSLLAVATESSSHPTGLEALYAQPWLWAGGGLGNIDECPLQTCVAGAGGYHRDTISFAAACIVPECNAHDVAAPDFPAVVHRASRVATDQDTARQYADGMTRIHAVNEYLGTGWICGEFVVPWRSWPFGVPYVVLCASFVLTVLYATNKHDPRKTAAGQRVNHRKQTTMTTITTGSATNATTANATTATTTTTGPHSTPLTGTAGTTEKRPLLNYDNSDPEEDEYHNVEEEKKIDPTMTPTTSASTLSFCWKSVSPSSSTSSFPTTEAHWVSNANNATTIAPFASLWSAFDARQHLRKLVQSPPPETVALDGLRVGSMLWIMLGHVMAIISSSGAGYANPQAFLPPDGLTNTVLGQLLFSSRLAVDTFLVISGFLTVHVLVHKLPLPPQNGDGTGTPGPLRRYVRHFPGLLLTRVARIMPLYIMCLLFFTQLAPQLGGGPFWYQWLALLKPCHDYGWTNLLFVNNFWPPDEPITNTCFYHSWYLAVDMQLFLAGAVLVFWYQARPRWAKIGTVALWTASVTITAVLAAVRNWSVNTFDGAAVARYDTEAYAKPHIRAVAYLTGMYVAMILPRHKLQQRSSWRSIHHVTMFMTLALMALITFATAFGAYSRRPCRYEDWPSLDHCGSTWSQTMTWFYASASRVLWCLGVGIILHLCLGRSAHGNPVASILSWRCWTPLSHLTFGAYLIHPVIIFIWQMGDREKENFRLATFGMDYISVGVVSYVAALVAALTVEFPCAALWKQWTTKKSRTGFQGFAHHMQPQPPQVQVVYGSVS